MINERNNRQGVRLGCGSFWEKSNASLVSSIRMNLLRACVFDGTNTTCAISGSYSGLGSGGAYQSQLVSGNGPSPLSAISTPASSNQFTFSLSQGSISFTLTPTGGKPIPFYDLHRNFFYAMSAT
jgi:hypothetical protein